VDGRGHSHTGTDPVQLDSHLTERGPEIDELTVASWLYTFLVMPRAKSAKPQITTTPSVAIERADEILTFTLDNPSHGNEVTGAMFDAMLGELGSEVTRPRARVLRIRARGKVFCTGRERAGRDLATLRRESERIIEFKRALRTSPLVSIAEVHGDAFGFGFGLAIVCDFVLVAQNASLGFPEMRHGLAPSAIMSYLGEYLLPRHAFPLVLFGDAISARRALEIGLISEVCPAAGLGKQAELLGKRILQLEAGAARRCKEFFLSAQQHSFDENSRLAVEALTVGSMAALEKQK
jgi:methylglutaconyl-CoA hydratase